MSINLVQSASAATSVTVLRSTTATIYVQATFDIDLTHGSTVIVAVGGVPVDAGPDQVKTPSVTDTLGNSYSQICWINASTQAKAVGLFIATNVLGGPCTVRFTCVSVNGNALFDLGCKIALAFGEFSGFGSSPTIQGSGVHQQDSGIGTVAVTIVDSSSISVNTSFGDHAQVSCAVADVAVAGADFFVAACIESSSSPANPTVTPSDYTTYILIENPNYSGVYLLSFFVRNTPVVVTATAFPTLASGSMVVSSAISGYPISMYPMNTTTSWLTRIMRFVDDSEQAWTVRQNLFSAQLAYEGVNGYDAARVEDFFHQQKGMWVDSALLNTFTIVINGVQYDWCVFDQDDLTITENPRAIGRFGFTLNIRQIKPN